MPKSAVFAIAAHDFPNVFDERFGENYSDTLLEHKSLVGPQRNASIEGFSRVTLKRDGDVADHDTLEQADH